jgi:hypothetical protein
MALWCPNVRWVWSGVSTAVWAVCFFFDFFDVLELLTVYVYTKWRRIHYYTYSDNVFKTVRMVDLP